MPKVFYNTISFVGLTIAGVAFGLIIFLIVLDAFAATSSPYMGLLTFVMLPSVLVFGLVVAFAGVFRTWRRTKRTGSEPVPFKIDFSNERHRTAFLVILNGGIFFAAVSAFGTYQAYEYTESVDFCGKVCHQVMKPEFTAYHESPHAKVPCAKCHIGSGADWYVRSKISGAYQVYSTIFNKYDRPIETPIANLRPAKETCEECHWPSHFYSQKLYERKYYLTDAENSQHDLTMLLKIGGVEHGSPQGIHAHMYLDSEITYIASDPKRQIIPYVEAKGKDGKVTIYRSNEVPISEELLKTGERRVVDCIDCHNRPSHIYRHPEFSLNTAMSNGQIDPSLPEIKAKAVEALEAEYKTEGGALAAIDKSLRDFYKKSYPDVVAQKGKTLDQAIAAVQKIYRTNYFPEMKVSWKAYPNNLDHLHSDGCFRCHDGKHVSDTGKVISKDCQSCHTIIGQKRPGEPREENLKGLKFKHPVDIGDAWETMACKDCHSAQKEE